jgi:hypothetical protein
MGEIADDDFDRMMDRACGLGGGDDWGFTRRVRPVCSRCGKRGLSWVEGAYGWVLYEGGQPHNCTSADDFDALP